MKHIYSYFALALFSILGAVVIDMVGTTGTCEPVKASGSLLFLALMAIFFFLGRAAGKVMAGE